MHRKAFIVKIRVELTSVIEMEILARKIERIISTGGYYVGNIKSYEAVLNKVGKPPIFEAANRLVKSVKPGDWVILTTGWIVPPFLPHGELDGPIGACALARAISLGLKANPFFVTEEAMIPVLKSTARMAGLRVVDLDTHKKMGVMGHSVVQSFPVDKVKAEKEAEALLAKLNPSAIISIEKAGRNENDIYHTGMGSDFSATVAKTDYLYDKAQEIGARALTIGIGDLGNEIGFGDVKKALEETMPDRWKCKCPCHGSIVTKVKADVPVYAECSNWGAYGVEAMLSGILKDPELLHDADTERRMFEGATEGGGLDGMLCRPAMSEHQWPVRYHMALIELLHGLVQARVETLDKKYDYITRART